MMAFEELRAIGYPCHNYLLSCEAIVVKIRPAIDEHDLYALRNLYVYLLEKEPTIDYVRGVMKDADIQVVESETGETVAFRVISRRKTMPLKQAFLWVAVAQDHRRRGIGHALMGSALREARQRGFTELISKVNDANHVGLGFCDHFNFQRQRHMVHMTLDWTRWDASSLEPRIKATQANGVQFITYAEVDNTIRNQRRLYDLNKVLSASIPITEPEDFPEFDPYVERRLSSDMFPHSGIFLAVVDGKWIGMTQISLHLDYAFVEMTGVLPAYRGRGIAQTLKHLSIRFAQQQDCTNVRTINDVQNEPMLAVNKKTGFQVEDGFYFVRRFLDETMQ